MATCTRKIDYFCLSDRRNPRCAPFAKPQIHLGVAARNRHKIITTWHFRSASVERHWSGHSVLTYSPCVAAPLRDHRKHKLPSCPITFRSSLSTNVRLNHEPGCLLELRRKEKKKVWHHIIIWFYFLPAPPPFCLCLLFSFFPSLPGYDLCADSGSGTFSAALACGYFRSVAFQVVHSTLLVSDVVTLFKRNKVFSPQTRSIALNQETFINCWTTFFFFFYLFSHTLENCRLFKFFRGSV